SNSEYLCLKLVAINKTVTHEFLSENLHKTPAAISRTLKKLIKKRLVSVVINPANQRKKTIKLTSLGNQIVKKSFADVRKVVMLNLRNISDDEYKSYIEITQKMLNDLYKG